MADGNPGPFDPAMRARVPGGEARQSDPGEIDNLPDHEILSDLDLSSHPDLQKQGMRRRRHLHREPPPIPALPRRESDRSADTADLYAPPWPEGG